MNVETIGVKLECDSDSPDIKCSALIKTNPTTHGLFLLKFSLVNNVFDMFSISKI